MIKLSFCLHRLPNLSHQEFCDYWVNTHGPLVRSHKGILRIQRYVQTHGMDDAELDGPLAASRGATVDAYDGVAELWWKSKEDLMEVVNDGAGQVALQILLDDEKKFIDLPRSPLWFSQENEIIALDS
jgi:hypothetical protein